MKSRLHIFDGEDDDCEDGEDYNVDDYQTENYVEEGDYDDYKTVRDHAIMDVR